MRGLRSVFQKLKKRANRVGRRDGISMAIVICIGALLLAFSLAMAYTGSLMMATANTRLEEERAYQLAKSFAQVLDEQLCGTTQTSFKEFAEKFIRSSFYQDYTEPSEDNGNDNEDSTNETVYTYSVDTSNLPKNYGSNVTVKLYKELRDENTETVLTKDTTSTGNNQSTAYATAIQTKEDTAWNRYDLVVVVVATYGDSKYAYKTEYSCKEYMRLQLTYTDSANESHDLYYNTNYYIYTDQGCTQAYNLDYSISYTYRTDSAGTIKRIFTPNTTEKGKTTTTTTDTTINTENGSE